MARLYLDYNASTPIDPEVVDVMRPLLMSDYGNPSSGHWAAAPARAALENASGQVAALLGCATDEIVFTSGGSEVNNLAKVAPEVAMGTIRFSLGRHTAADEVDDIVGQLRRALA